MRGGIWVLNIFGALWGAAGIIVGHQPTWLVVLPLTISATILFRASRQPVAAGNSGEGGHIDRLVGIWSAVEGVAIFLTANVLINLHLPTAIMPAIAIIVGLHFVPLARGIPVRLYYATGAAMIVVGLAALSLPAPDRALATGVAAALIMWTSAVKLVGKAKAKA